MVKRAPAFEPYACSDPASVLGGRRGRVLVLAPSFNAVRCVQAAPAVTGHLAVRDRVIMDSQLKMYSRLDPEEFPLQSLVRDIKEEMLNHGATPEAVMLVGAYSPFNEKEMNIMAEKLKKTAAKKTSTKKADTKGKAETAEATTDDRKIKVVKKPHEAREGTKRASMLDTIYDSKTVQEAVAGGVSKSDVSWAAREGYIEVK